MLNEEKARLVLEMLSISDEVEKATEGLFTETLKVYAMYPYKKIKPGMNRRNFKLPYKLFGYDTTIDFTVYTFTDNRTYYNEMPQIKRVDYFNEETNTIGITVILLHGRVCGPNAESTIRHELLHFYEWCKKGAVTNELVNASEGAYLYAANIIYGGVTPKDSAKYRIAQIMYYSRWGEQDAYVNSYPTQVKYSTADYLDHSTETETHFKIFEDNVKWLESNMNNPDVVNALKEYEDYGFTPNYLLNYARKNLNRFKNKLNHARTYVQNRMEGNYYIGKTLNEKILRESKRLIDKIVEEENNNQQ